MTHRNGAYYYVIAEDILTNEIYQLDAYTKDAENVVPKWVLSDGSEYYGNSMYIRSALRDSDNMITLRTAAGSDLTYMTLSGTIVSSTMNLASGRSATDQNPAEGAIISYGVTGAIADENGKFTVPAASLCGSNGRVRFMLGVIVSIGGGQGYSRQENPFHQLHRFQKSAKSSPEVEMGSAATELIHNDPNVAKAADKGMQKKAASNYGGFHFKFSAFIGFYLDYGYIEISKNGGAEKSHDMIFMGGGGFLGFSGTLGYTFSFLLVTFPAYINLEAGIGVTFFIGASADPNKTLDSMKETKVVKGQDFGFNFEIKGNAYFTGTFGIGIYKIVGIRVSAGIGFEVGYSPKIPKWYPEKFDVGFGYVSEITFAGTIDLILTSIDLYSASWPLPLADGYLYYFQEVRRGNLCISYVENGIKSAKANNLITAEQEATARGMINELADLIDNDSADVETIMAKTKALKNYAYDNNMLSWVAKNRIEMNKQGGIAGTIINAVLQDDTDESGIRFHTNEHTEPKWVANDGQLMAAFSAVETTALVENAYAQPSSRIVNLGGGRFLMVFLDDTVSRDKQQAATLKWTVFDGSTWSEPKTVQADITADGKPNLVDAGDKVILSWSSMTDAKYETLKNTVKQELKDAGKSDTDVDVQEALEKDPARVMRYMDIFTAEFDKTSGTFGEVKQLTDDDIYDDNPQTVYDSKTKDYIVLYYKTAQDISSYAVQAIQWAVGDSVITGFEDGTMRPKANANRAQMAVILNKIADLF